MREARSNPAYLLALPLSLHCLSVAGYHDPQIDPSEKKLLVVESLRFRILEIDLQRLLPEAPARENPLAAALTFCGEDEALPEGVRIFASALPGVLLCVCVFFVTKSTYAVRHSTRPP